ncbi:DUF6765 family protein [Vibrio coralliilyticus]|uniref:DUF6765 family protein n=1 Tax=Vibrio coralliilyticus TaxID=190893 RepID=UPI000BAB0F26|nr:DUF6765 family protein [Vibrio coralliilyticus]NOI58458.1 hypothetical protein [Vibrio coralliilyticus]PAT68381.1 hypothetical protein CKA27_07735 [Vibrio coralliilyticus]
MDYDFHYYGTKTAALLAGWSAEEAEEIAEAALFIDYCDWKNFGYDIDGNGKYVVYTAQFNDLYTNTDLKADPSIWVPFHFLPGNYNYHNADPNFRTRNTKDSLDKVSGSLCRPYSYLALKMIDHTRDVINQHKLTGKAKTYWIGARMHILADTWAHQDFSGLSDSELNNIAGDIEFFDYKEKRFLDLTQWPMFTKEDTKASPNMLSSVGHGNAGHLPDISWGQYRYRPNWANENVVLFRDNRVKFREAFMKLTEVLYFLRTGHRPDVFVRDNREDKWGISQNICSILYLGGRRGTAIVIPQRIMEIINTPQQLGSGPESCFSSTARLWHDYLKSKGITNNVERTGNNQTDWERALIDKYKNGITKERWKSGFANLLSFGTYQTAQIVPKSDFEYFQAAAGSHLLWAIQEMSKIPQLNETVKQVKEGWMYKNAWSIKQ